MGGSDKKKTVSEYRAPWYIDDASQRAVGIGRKIAGQEYTPYEGQRVAPLSANEQLGIRKGREAVGVGNPYFDKAEQYAERGSMQFRDANIQEYMNPYIKGALDPAAREIREEGARGAMALDERSASMNAFGGSRAALMRSENREKTIQGISDLYGKGYAAAYESAVGIWGDERARDMQAAGRFQELGISKISAAQTDVSTLMTTGATDRGIQQSMADFDYQQFTENRDWDFRNLAGLLAAIQGTKGSYSTKEVTTSGTKEDNTAEIAGAVIQIVAAMYSDERLKDNIVCIGMCMGHKIYTWTWNALAQVLGINTPTIGVLAQEVRHTGHVIERDGLLMVDYRSLFAGE